MRLELDWKRLCFLALCVLFAALTFSTALVETAFFIALVFWVLWKGKQGKVAWGEGWHPGFGLLAAFSVFCALTFFWSEFPKQSGKGILKVSEHFFLMWMARDVLLGHAEKRKFEKFILWLFAVVVLDAAAQYFLGRDLIRGYAGEPASSGVRLSASFKTYGLFGAFLVVTLPFMTALALQRWSLRKGTGFVTQVLNPVPFLKSLLPFLLVLLGGTGLFLTRSRGAMVAFAGSTVVLFILRCEWKRVFGILLALLLLVALLPKGMLIHLDLYSREQSLVERFYLWDRAVQVIRAKPLGGTGINTYTRSHERYDRTRNWRVKGYYAHNGLLQTAAETGLTGLALFLAGLAFVFRRALSGPCPPWAVLTGLWGFLLMACVDTILHNNQSVMLFWFWIGLCEAYSASKIKIDKGVGIADGKGQAG